MKKFIRYSLILSLVLVLSLFININVNQNIEVHAAGYTITFDSNGGSSIPSISDAIELPDPLPIPTKPGYLFTGWRYDNDDVWSGAYAGDPLTTDVTLYAGWLLKPYTITFESNGGSLISPLEGVWYFPEWTSIYYPTRPGYIFTGWYMDSSLTMPAITGERIPSHITLYARWRVNTYTISFETNGGNAIPSLSETITNGYISISTLPTPERDTDIFTGWFYDKELTNRVLLNQIVYNDITIYARWITTDKIPNLEDIASDYGENDGFDKGLTDGENRGYTYGFDDGYNKGYEKGKIDGSNKDIEVLEENAYNSGYYDARETFAYKRGDKYLDYNQAFQLGSGESGKLKEIVAPLIIFMLISTVVFSAIKILGGKKE